MSPEVLSISCRRGKLKNRQRTLERGNHAPLVRHALPKTLLAGSRITVERPDGELVKRHICPHYACRACEGSEDEDKPIFRSEIREPRLLAGSIASSSALAFILIRDTLRGYQNE